MPFWMGYCIPNECCSRQTGRGTVCAPAGWKWAAPHPRHCHCHRQHFYRTQGTGSAAREQPARSVAHLLPSLGTKTVFLNGPSGRSHPPNPDGGRASLTRLTANVAMASTAAPLTPSTSLALANSRSRTLPSPPSSCRLPRWLVNSAMVALRRGRGAAGCHLGRRTCLPRGMQSPQGGRFFFFFSIFKERGFSAVPAPPPPGYLGTAEEQGSPQRNITRFSPGPCRNRERASAGGGGVG